MNLNLSSSSSHQSSKNIVQLLNGEQLDIDKNILDYSFSSQKSSLQNKSLARHDQQVDHLSDKDLSDKIDLIKQINWIKRFIKQQFNISMLESLACSIGVTTKTTTTLNNPRNQELICMAIFFYYTKLNHKDYGAESGNLEIEVYNNNYTMSFKKCRQNDKYSIHIMHNHARIMKITINNKKNISFQEEWKIIVCNNKKNTSFNLMKSTFYASLLQLIKPTINKFANHEINKIFVGGDITATMGQILKLPQQESVNANANQEFDKLLAQLYITKIIKAISDYITTQSYKYDYLDKNNQTHLDKNNQTRQEINKFIEQVAGYAFKSDIDKLELEQTQQKNTEIRKKLIFQISAALDKMLQNQEKNKKILQQMQQKKTEIDNKFEKQDKITCILEGVKMLFDFRGYNYNLVAQDDQHELEDDTTSEIRTIIDQMLFLQIMKLNNEMTEQNQIKNACYDIDSANAEMLNSLLLQISIEPIKQPTEESSVKSLPLQNEEEAKSINDNSQEQMQLNSLGKEKNQQQMQPKQYKIIELLELIELLEDNLRELHIKKLALYQSQQFKILLISLKESKAKLIACRNLYQQLLNSKSKLYDKILFMINLILQDVQLCGSKPNEFYVRFYYESLTSLNAFFQNYLTILFKFSAKYQECNFSFIYRPAVTEFKNNGGKVSIEKTSTGKVITCENKTLLMNYFMNDAPMLSDAVSYFLNQITFFCEKPYLELMNDIFFPDHSSSNNRIQKSNEKAFFRLLNCLPHLEEKNLLIIEKIFGVKFAQENGYYYLENKNTKVKIIYMNYICQHYYAFSQETKKIIEEEFFKLMPQIFKIYFACEDSIEKESLGFKRYITALMGINFYYGQVTDTEKTKNLLLTFVEKIDHQEISRIIKIDTMLAIKEIREIYRSVINQSAIKSNIIPQNNSGFVIKKLSATIPELTTFMWVTINKNVFNNCQSQWNQKMQEENKQIQLEQSCQTISSIKSEQSIQEFNSKQLSQTSNLIKGKQSFQQGIELSRKQSINSNSMGQLQQLNYPKIYDLVDQKIVKNLIEIPEIKVYDMARWLLSILIATDSVNESTDKLAYNKSLK